MKVTPDDVDRRQRRQKTETANSFTSWRAERIQRRKSHSVHVSIVRSVGQIVVFFRVEIAHRHAQKSDMRKGYWISFMFKKNKSQTTIRTYEHYTTLQYTCENTSEGFTIHAIYMPSIFNIVNQPISHHKHKFFHWMKTMIELDYETVYGIYFLWNGWSC